MRSDYILMFINYLLIPFIALSIDLRRSKDAVAMSLKAFMQYVSYMVTIVIVMYIIRVVLSRLGIGVDVTAGSSLYTIAATVIALIIPYIKEIIATYVNVRCEIKGKTDK